MSNKIGTAKKPDCVTLPIAGNWCDISLSTDPDVDNAINTSNILVFVETCGSDQKVEYFQDIGGTLATYTPIGAILDCDSFEEPQIPPPDCPENAVFDQVCISANSYGILDNSNFVNSPTPHLKNGTALVIDLIHEDGTTTSIGPLDDPYFNSFMKGFAEALPGCVVKAVCANHTSPKGCAAIHVENLAEYPAYDAPTFPGDIQNNLTNPAVGELWGTGWLLDCAGCDSPIVRAEISDSSVAGYIGAYKDIIVHKGEEKTYFRAVTCDGTFWKDCKTDEPIQPPAGACCAKPCNNTSEIVDLLNSLKVIKQNGLSGADYNGAFRYINGRPPASSAWALIDNRDPANQVTIASGANLNAFTADLESKGYTEWNTGEEHWVCPCPPGLTVESTGAYFTTVDGETSEKLFCAPLSEVPDVPEAKIVSNTAVCALRTEECNSEKILAAQNATNTLLTDMLAKWCAPCPLDLQITVDPEGTLIPNPVTVPGNVTQLNGTTQTMFDTLGNAIGTAIITAVVGKDNTTLVTVKPVTPVKDVVIGSISTLVPLKTAVKG